MELLLILIYVSICYVVFKVFKIPVNQWSLATAALGGIIGIAAASADHELQPSVHHERADLFLGHAGVAGRAGARHRGAGRRRTSR